MQWYAEYSQPQISRSVGVCRCIIKLSHPFPYLKCTSERCFLRLASGRYLTFLSHLKGKIFAQIYPHTYTHFKLKQWTYSIDILYLTDRVYINHDIFEYLDSQSAPWEMWLMAAVAMHDGKCDRWLQWHRPRLFGFCPRTAQKAQWWMIWLYETWWGPTVKMLHREK